MPIDEPLLQRAKRAWERMSEADRAALLARAEYHTAVRRLHLAGGTLREIGVALQVSHQRVQQIVETAGGSWWNRIWKSRSARRDAVCTFCSRPPSEVKKLVAGPDVFVCDGCVGKAERAVAKGTSTAFEVVRKTGKAKCSFCRLKSGANHAVVASVHAAVCTDCLTMCRQIMSSRAT